MKRVKEYLKTYYWIYAGLLLLFAGAALLTNRAVDAAAMAEMEKGAYHIVIDPGHGGEDGGAVSCTGVLESQLNLEISLRLNDLMHLLGYRTTMTRTADVSIYTQGDTVAQRKTSDLKNRAAIVNNTGNALLISIHQNLFSDGRYSGGQIFYAPTADSQNLAEQMQAAWIAALNPDSHRACKPAEGVYLMQHIACPGILVECGFLSNQAEESKLRTADYQKKLCCVLAATISSFP